MTKAVKATLTEDQQSIAIEFLGEVSFQESVAFSNAIILQTIEAFKHQIKEEDEEAYLGAMYDDLNIRFMNILNNIIPDEDLNLDFTAEAQQALRDEDEYIDLKFKALQYDKIVEKDRKTMTVTLKDNGELTV